MKIYLTPTSAMNSTFTSQDVISAYILQKKENGYIVNIGGTEVFAHCLLDLNIGDFLKLKVADSSTSQIAFKVIQYEAKESQTMLKPLMSLDIPHIPETQTAFNLLLKLNLPIKKESLTFIMDLLSQLIDEEKPEPLLPSANDLPSQAEKLFFHKTLTKFINSGPIMSEEQLLELLQDSTALEDEVFALDKTLTNNQTKARALKKHLALKALNLLHNKGCVSHVNFYSVPIPVYHNIYLKVTEDPSTDNTQASMHLSFIVNTKNLGAVLVDLTFINGKVSASSTFEDKKALDTVKNVLDMNKNAHNLIKTMILKVGKVSLKDFFFSEIKERPITTGINLKV